MTQTEFLAKSTIEVCERCQAETLVSVVAMFDLLPDVKKLMPHGRNEQVCWDCVAAAGQSTSAKVCTYKGCGAEFNGEFKVCEKCRFAQNALIETMLIDPSSPQPHVKHDDFITTLLTNMTVDEVRNKVSRLEAVYMSYLKWIKLHAPESSSRRARQTLEEQIEEARIINEGGSIRSKQAKKSVTKAEKKKKKADTVIQKQMRALGCNDSCMGTTACPHEKEARRIFNDDFGDL
jgi:UDP-2,3-diacylglucosamine pyrophosphatase LpxH